MNLSDLAIEEARLLPFVAETDSGLSFWVADTYGHQDTDIAVGEHFANLALGVASRLEAPELVAVIMADMVRAGRFTALEAGFLATVAMSARCGRLN